MSTHYLKVLMITSLLFCGNIALAQDQQTDAGTTQQQAGAKASTESPALLEEITVVGEQTFFSIRGQITRAEDNVYSMFNDLNSNDDFDIVCRTIRTTNSYIPRRRCEPEFFYNMRKQSSQFALSEIRQAWSEEGIDAGILETSMTYMETDSELHEKAAKTFEELNEEILRIATEHPEYLKALMQVDALKKVLEEERQKRFGN